MAKLTFHQKLTFHARHSLEEASRLAKFTKNIEVSIEHLLLALFLEKGSLGSILLRGMGFETETLSSYCLQKSDSLRLSNQTPSLSEAVKTVMRRAYSLANEFQYPYVGTEHFVYALMEIESESLDALLETLKIDDKKIESTLAAHMNFDNLPSLGKILETPESPFAKKDIHGETPFLDQFATNLNEDSRKRNDAFIGREHEIDRLIQILSRKNKNNPLLIGPPGVGKTALVSALAQRIESGNVPYYLLEKKVFALDLALVVAGTNFRGEFENRLKEIIKEVQENPNIILFIDEIHTLVGAGNTQGGLDAANILKPALARAEIRCIGATTFEEFKKHIEKDAALERRFQSVELTEPTQQEAEAILKGVRHTYETFHGISLPSALLERAVKLSVRFLPDRYLPDKALDILDEALSLARHSIPASEDIITKGNLERKLRLTEEKKQNYIREEAYDEAALVKEEEQIIHKQLKELEKRLVKNTSEPLPVLKKVHIDKVVARMARIPSDVIANDNPLNRIERLRTSLAKNLIGQNKASEEILHTLSHASISPDKGEKPFASFLFLGPTGVGKTYSAKIIAREFFSQDDALIRFDMSEFGERHSVAQMIGAPAGYVGFGEGGKLTEAVRRRPYSVVLFDEIDKAHPDIWNILLQILDEGTLTDAEGKTVDFRNTVIILTSNQGTEVFTSGNRIGFDANTKVSLSSEKRVTQENNLLKKVQKTLRPELFARLGTILVFTPLTEIDMKKIVREGLKKLKTDYKEKGITLTFSPPLTTWLTKKSMAMGQGARSVTKIFRDTLERTLITELLTSPEKKEFHFSLDAANTLVSHSLIKPSSKKSARS